ncbi:unnamed protein product [Dicrocoelium dendriticum]|nr:unnamed protein product [Dicrocoelium dendriticum]
MNSRSFRCAVDLYLNWSNNMSAFSRAIRSPISLHGPSLLESRVHRSIGYIRRLCCPIPFDVVSGSFQKRIYDKLTAVQSISPTIDPLTSVALQLLSDLNAQDSAKLI